MRYLTAIGQRRGKMEKKRFRLVLPSTKTWFQEARQIKGFSFFDMIHSYIYARWPYFYIRVGTGRHPLTPIIAPIATRLIALFAHKRYQRTGSGPAPENQIGITFANTYHGKVVPLEAARQLVSVKEEIKAALPESILPYDRARDLILKNPDHIVALDCPCRVARENPCLPLDVCLIIGEPFTGFIREHEPTRSRWISSTDAEEILLAENKRGHVHHAFFKDAMLGRFYAICNCCSCCCGAMKAQRGGTPMLASSGFVAQVDETLCKGCQKCQKHCQFEAIEMTSLNGSKQQTAVVDYERCMGCGICVNQCSKKAISLQLDPAKGEPLEIFKLMEEARQAAS
jgi:Pyruvate/2-oxoacid:ferredoxin oxidoreductase delta subunit